MFDKIRNTLFWANEFDSAWNSRGTFFCFLKLDYDEEVRLKEKKYLWRQERGRALTPQMAVFRALEEFADEYRRRHPDHHDMIMEMAPALEYAAPSEGSDGRYRDRVTFLSDFWRGQLVEKQERDKAWAALEREFSSYKFSDVMLEVAWEDLCQELPVGDACRVWDRMFPRTTAAKLVRDTGLSVEYVALCVRVFDRYLDIDVHTGTKGTTIFRRQEQDDLMDAVHELYPDI